DGPGVSPTAIARIRCAMAPRYDGFEAESRNLGYGSTTPAVLSVSRLRKTARVPTAEPDATAQAVGGLPAALLPIDRDANQGPSRAGAADVLVRVLSAEDR